MNEKNQMLNKNNVFLKNFSIFRILIWIILIFFAVLIVIPLIFMFTASIMPATQILKMPYPWFTGEVHWQNYWNGIKGPYDSFIYIRNILNSIIVSTSVTFTTVILSAITGYSLAKFDFKGKTLIFMIIMGTMMVPFEAIMVPLYMVALNLGINDSYAGLILPFLTNAFGIFMMRQYLITFPDDMLDSARIDGAGEFKIFWQIVLPNCKPVIATLAVLTFRTQWDNLLWPLMVIQSEDMKTIPLYITRFLAETNTDEGIMMAIAATASIPIFILFFNMSKYFINSGVHSGSKN
jgi:multiple sugar transport system permease protein